MSYRNILISAPDTATVSAFHQQRSKLKPETFLFLLKQFSKCYVDVELQPIRRKNEFRAFCSLMDRFEANDNTKPIFIADRGFCSYNVFAHAIENQVHFLIRPKDSYLSRLSEEDISGRELGVSLQRIFSRTRSKKKMLHPECSQLYRYVCSNVDFDYISKENPEYSMQLRVVRFQIAEDT